MNEMDYSFERVAQIIETSRTNAYRKVNEELILMYQHVGRFLSEKAKRSFLWRFIYRFIGRFHTGEISRNKGF